MEQKKNLLEQRSDLYLLTGSPEKALEDLLFIQSQYQDKSDYLQLRIFQLSYEIGQWNFFSDLSKMLLLQQGLDKIPYIILEARLLMSRGQWNEAGDLLDQYKSLASESPSLSYLNWFFHQRTGNNNQAQYWSDSLNDTFPHSIESLMVRGLAEQKDSPGILFLSHQNDQEVFYYQAGAFRSEEAAEELQNELESYGINAETRFRDNWYKVIIATTKSQDSRLIQQLEQWDIKAFKVSP